MKEPYGLFLERKNKMENYIELKTKEGTLRGMWHVPSQKPYPLVIMLHGFTANRNGPRFAFVRLARQLEKLGIGSVRFDFLGSGESDLEFSDMTFNKEFEQACQILERMAKEPEVSQLYLLGHSMGGALAGQLAAKYANQIQKCVLWAPAFCMPQLIGAMSSQVKQLANGCYDCKGLDLSQAFVDEMLQLNLYQGLDQYRHPLMIIHGTEDPTVPYVTSKQYLKAFNREDILFKPLDKGSHNYEFNREVHFVLEHTIDFYKV